VTLTGPAGVGKTRLALEVAARMAPVFGGATFVPLAAVAEPGMVSTAIARALGVREAPSPSPSPSPSPIASLGRFLRHQRRLLVLDNFEHLLDAAPVVLDLLAASDGLTVLATSRAALRLSGEQEFPVPPLAVPRLAVPAAGPAPPGAPPAAVDAIEAAAAAEAVQLFVARAQAIDPAFALSAETAMAVAGICHRLDGLPLAIELAAAGVRLFSPAALLTRLESPSGGLSLLASGPRDAPARHQTLQAAIGWSYDLLAAEEQALLRRLAVFAGGCTLAAAEAVCGLSPSDTVERLAGLVTQSLVRREDDGAGGPRFGMLETVREFALARLEASDEATTVRERHADFYFVLANIPDTEFSGRWLDAVEQDHQNLRAAMRWCMSRGGEAGVDGVGAATRGLRLAAALARLWCRRGQLSQGRAELDWALAWPEPVEPSRAYWRERGIVLTKAGHLARGQGDYAAARHHYEAGLALRRRTGQTGMLPFSLGSLGGLALDQGDYATARACYDEALALRRARGARHLCLSLFDAGQLAQEEGDDAVARRYFDEALALAQARAIPHAVAAAHEGLGRLAWRRGDNAAARAHLEAALAIARDLGAKGAIAAALDHLGRVAQAQGDTAEAARRHAAALNLAWEFGDRLRVAWCLEALAAVATFAGSAQHAARLLGAAAAQRETLGAPVPPSQRPWYERHLVATRAALPGAAFAAAWDQGLAMAPEQAVAAALSICQVPLYT
jgi:predicted ATPase